MYRLHPLVPDLIEYRDWRRTRTRSGNKIPVVETFRGKATEAMHERGLANWALSMGRQRLGLLTLQNHPRFLQNLKMRPAAEPDAADRRRGARPHPRPRARRAALQRVPPAVRAAAADELRRLHRHAAADGLAGAQPSRSELVDDAARGLRPAPVRRVEGHHRRAARTPTASPINDCLGHPNGSDGRQHRGRRHGGRLAGGDRRGRTASRSPRRSSWCSS